MTPAFTETTEEDAAEAAETEEEVAEEGCLATTMATAALLDTPLLESRDVPSSDLCRDNCKWREDDVVKYARIDLMLGLASKIDWDIYISRKKGLRIV